jgi:septal ring factor EnvC (AmiA/AmiB activator)
MIYGLSPVEKVEGREKSTVPLPELKENGTVSDPNVPSKAIENSYQEIVPQDQKDIAELKEHSNGFETNEIQISLAVTEADSVGLEANKQRKKMEDFQDQAAECNGNSYEEIMNLRLQLQQSHLALSGSEKLVAELRESLSGAEQRAEQLAFDLTEGLFLSRNLECSLGIM